MASVDPKRSAAARRRFREIGERLNARRQIWEISLRLDRSAPATLVEVNFLAGVIAELLHEMAYGEQEGRE